MNTRPHSLWLQNRSVLILAALTMLSLVAACGVMDDKPTDPGVHGFLDSPQRVAESNDALKVTHLGPNGFFPLDIGNRWTYTGEMLLTVGEGPPEIIHTEEERTIVGTEELFERQYILEQQQIVYDMGDDVSTYWVRYRQDRAGLYEADVPVTQPPSLGESVPAYPSSHISIKAKQLAILWQQVSVAIPSENHEAYRQAWDRLSQKMWLIDEALRQQAPKGPVLLGPPGGVLPDEITRLGYPLHPRQEWVIRDDPFLVEAIVEGHEVLDLAPGRMGAFRIRIVNDFLDPNDLALVWYGSYGFLGLFTHVETVVTDPSGNPIDELVFEESQFLESLDLIGHGRHFD